MRLPLKKEVVIAGALWCMLSGLFSCNKEDQIVKDDTFKLEGIPVKVMTYNIYGARADSGPPADLPAIAAVINKYKPDLVALQEVDVYTRRTGTTVHQADSLGKLTGMSAFFAKAIDRQGGEYGDAVLSRYPLLEKKVYNMGTHPSLGGETRSVALVKVKVDDKEVYFAATHLDHLSSEANRLFQAEALRNIVAGINGHLIMGGDFNAIPTSQTISIIKEYMTIGTADFSPTFPSTDPNRTIDYIMYKPKDAFIVQNYQVIREPGVSDHCAIFSVIRIK